MIIKMSIKNIIVFAIFFLAAAVWAEENSITINGIEFSEKQSMPGAKSETEVVTLKEVNIPGFKTVVPKGSRISHVSLDNGRKLIAISTVNQLRLLLMEGRVSIIIALDDDIAGASTLTVPVNGTWEKVK